MKIPIALIVSIFISYAAQALEEAEVQRFFERYQRLSEEFSVQVADLYLDNATISTLRHSADGSAQKMSIGGKQFKELLVQVMAAAKETGDISRFSNIEVSIEGETATITAHRYSVLKESTDEGYFMVVTKTDGGELRISAEHTETRAPDPVADGGATDLQSLLKVQVDRLKEHLPLMADSDTRLDSVVSEGGRLSYHYTLISVSIAELDLGVFEATIRNAVAGQSCSNPEFRQIFSLGGSVAFVYSDKEGARVAEVVVAQADCE